MPSAPLGAAPASSTGLLCLLGTPRLQPTGAAALLLGPRDAALLALVVLDGPVARATLAGWMWPDLAPAQALNNLRQRLFQLRKQAGGVLLQDGDSLALAPGWQHDLAPQPLQWRAGHALPQLLGGVDLAAWPLLAERIDAQRKRWRRAWQDAMVGQAEQLESADRLAQAQALAAAVVQADPTSEHAHRRLMRLHYLRGDNAAALAAYAACQHLLQQHLDTTPGAETRALRDLVAAGAALARPALVSAAHQPPGPQAQSQPQSDPQAPASAAMRPSAAAFSALPPPVAAASSPSWPAQAAVPEQAADPLQALQVSLPQQRALLRRPPVLAGRDAAWQAMAAAWHAGQPILLQGPAGVGKSRLAEDFARAQGPVQVWRVQRTPGVQPWSALVDWLGALQPLLPAPPAWALPVLAHLLPQLLPQLPPQSVPDAPPHTRSSMGQPVDAPAPQLLQQAVLAWLAAWPQAGLGALLIDDWPAIDAASLQVLVAWLRQDTAPPARLLLVQTTGTADPPPPATAGPPWWLRGADGEPLQLVLSPLSQPAMADLLADLAAAQALPGVAEAQLPLLAQRLHQASGGLPGAALALLRSVPAAAWCASTRWVAHAAPPGGLAASAARSDGPATAASHADGLAAARQSALAAVLASRMAALPPPALRLLRLAALAAAQFDVPLAAAVLGVHALDLSDHWLLLRETHWLDSDGLLPEPLRDAVAAGVPAAIRQVLHAQLAQALTSDGAAPEHCWRHWAAAQRWPEAAAAAADTARQAKAAHMPRAALAAWDAAGQACDAAGDTTGAWQARLGAVWPAMSVEPAAQVLQRTAQLHATAADGPQRISALLARCRVALNMSDSALALAPAEAALALATATGDSASALHARGWLWLARAMDGAIQPALVQLQACAQAVLGLPDPIAHLRLRLDVLGALGYVQHMAGAYQAAVASFSVAADCAEQLGELGDALEQWLNLSLCASAVGDRPRALQAGDRALVLWRRQGEPAGGAVPSLQLELGQLQMAQGQFSSGLPLLEQALAYFRHQPGSTWQVIAEHRLANAWLALGQPARARQALGPLPDDASAGGRIARAMVLARLAQLAGQPALGLLQDALQQHGDALEVMDRRSLQLQLAGTEAPAAALLRCDALLHSLGGHPAAAGGGPAAATSADQGTAATATATATADVADAGMTANRPALVHALARRADALRQLGRTGEAVADAGLAWQLSALAPPLGLGHLQLCHLVAQAAAQADDLALLRQVSRSALDWLGRALPYVLPAWRHGFLHQHPVHRALLALLAAHGHALPLADAQAVAAV